MLQQTSSVKKHGNLSQGIPMISNLSLYRRNWCFKNFVKTLSHPALNNYRPN